MANAEIVVLANSIKHHQHCVAGKCTNTRKWIRPVSDEQGAELSHDQTRYKNTYGTYSVKPLQKIRMGFTKHVPLPHQPENYLIDGDLWRQNYSIRAEELLNYLDSPSDLWGNDARVEYSKIILGAHPIPQSLYLVKVDDLHLFRTNEGKRRASFLYNGIEYDLPATDPSFDRIVDGQIEIKGILCISLGEEYHGYCYKLVATIF